MKNIFFILLIFAIKNAFSQAIPYYGSNFPVDTTCAWNTDIEFITTKGWVAYQTLDDTYNGVIDSSICVSLKADTSAYAFSFLSDDFDTSRAIYIKADLNALNKISLESDAVYFIDEGIFYAIPNLNLSTDCADLVCTAIIVGIEIPDSTMMSKTTRWHFINASAFESGFCIPTEKFDNQYLTDYIIKMTFAGAGIDDTITTPASASLQQVYDITLITDLINASGFYDDTVYIIPGDQIINSTTGILKYNEAFYPSTDHFDFIDVTPDPNPSDVTTINIQINEYQTLLT